MKRFIQGEHRGQSTLLPESLDDYVSDTNPVRVVDVFVDELDLAKLGFDGCRHAFLWTTIGCHSDSNALSAC
jgi:transposase